MDGSSIKLAPEYHAVLIRHVESESAHRMDETLATLTPDCVFEDRALGRVWHGRDGARAYYRMWWDAFRVVPHGGRRYVPAPDTLVVETRFKGRHDGPFLGIAPTGRTVDIPIAIFVSFADGLMSGERFYWNLGDLMQQIGVAMPYAAVA